MAKVVGVVKEKVVTIKELVLTVTEQEAVTLRTIFQYIGGPLDTSRRQHATELDELLADAGIGLDLASHESGDISFKDDSLG